MKSAKSSKAAKAGKSVFFCQECGHRSSRWLGRCPSCEAWNSFVEEIETTAPRAVQAPSAPSATVALSEVESGAEATRLATGSSELDRVLGGGLVPGSAVLLGGDPGIGKSTLALQLASGVAAGGRPSAGPVLYVAGEEAPAQVSLRAGRLGVATGGIFVASTTDTPNIVAAIRERRPAVAVIDSVQTIYTPRAESAPGSVTQLREASAELITVARECNVAVVLIGHVTKEGTLAGPRVLEHMVDSVLYFEGDKNYVFRILRAVKNRFGPANEIGIFEMVADGLREVTNPSEAFAGTARAEASGSVVTATMEGSRPLLIEVQALVAPSNPGSARRTTLGVDHGRVAMLAAVMEKRMGLAMINHDVFVNTVGGVRVDDPGVDLAVVAALASSYVDRPLPNDLVVLGEVGLTGEVRAVGQVRARVREAERMGFERLLLPQASLARPRPPRRPRPTAWRPWRRLGSFSAGSGRAERRSAHELLDHVLVEGDVGLLLQRCEERGDGRLPASLAQRLDALVLDLFEVVVGRVRVTRAHEDVGLVVQHEASRDDRTVLVGVEGELLEAG
jgi:DNA repair protein RadA/Sms